MLKKTAIFALILLIPVLAGCALSKKEAIETSEVVESEQIEALTDGTYQLKTDESTVYWEAYKPVGGHMGNISLKSGELIVKDGQPQSGSFEMDMTSITDSDLENEEMNAMLVNHLKSDDFFSVADYPTSRFDITKVSSYEGEEDWQYKIEGDLSIKDVTEAVTVYAKITQNGDRLLAEGKSDINRTKFGITIRSGSFFENLGDKLIKDEFTLELDLVAERLQEDL